MRLYPQHARGLPGAGKSDQSLPCNGTPHRTTLSAKGRHGVHDHMVQDECRVGARIRTRHTDCRPTPLHGCRRCICHATAARTQRATVVSRRIPCSINSKEQFLKFISGKLCLTDTGAFLKLISRPGLHPAFTIHQRSASRASLFRVALADARQQGHKTRRPTQLTTFQRLIGRHHEDR